MVKHIQTIRRPLPTNCLTVFEHFVCLALKGLSVEYSINIRNKHKLGTPELHYLYLDLT